MKWPLTKNATWGLTQGMLGAKRATMHPSEVALGPNTYLSEQDFFKMLGAAFLLHMAIFLIAGLFPSEKVTNIPVRALSFKLGDQDVVAAYGSPTAVGMTMKAAPPITAPVMTTSGADWRASNAPAPVMPAPLKALPKPAVVAAYTPKPVKAPKVYRVNDPAPRQVPVQNGPPLAPLPTPVSQQPAIAPNPQQYVREVGAPSAQMVAAVAKANAIAGAADGAVNGTGTQSTMTEQSMRAIRDRYEQEISGWIQQHKSYPASANGREGRAVVRMRIDRAGNVRYYAIEVSAGNPALDAAAIDMIRRANPVPAVPANYPAGNLVEFLIPITFKAPQ